MRQLVEDLRGLPIRASGQLEVRERIGSVGVAPELGHEHILPNVLNWLGRVESFADGWRTALAYADEAESAAGQADLSVDEPYILATIGLYGIMAYNVARRRNEIGVRIALGAERSRVIRLVLREVATIVLAGVAIGMGLSLGLARLVVAFLYGVAPWDVATFASAAVVLVAVGLAAAALPAWRASRLDPVAALREE